MATKIIQADLQQEVLDKLSHALDLVLQTAEAASTANNHKMVIQAAREATRIATLITKKTTTRTTPAGLATPQQASQPAAPGQSDLDDICAEDLILPDIETFLPPERVASWDDEIKSMYAAFAKNYREFQDLCDEVAAGLPVAGRITALQRGQGSQSATPFTPALKVA
jgi:hypothetical protein